MKTVCPNCGHEFEMDIDIFRSMLRNAIRNYPGFAEVVVEEAMKDSNLFKKFREKIETEIKEQHKAERKQKEEKHKFAREAKARMSVDERIEFLNTPWEELPEELKAGTVMRPMVHNYIRMSHPNIGYQQETTGARILRFRDDYNLSQKDFCDMVNVFAKKFDLPESPGRRAQITRVKPFDLDNYEYDNVCPKHDKLTAISEAMGVAIDYFCGYGPDYRRPNNEVVGSRYRKGPRKPKTGGDAAIPPEAV